MNREQMIEQVNAVQRRLYGTVYDAALTQAILDLIASAERSAAEKTLREAADDFEVTASLGGSVIERLRARADEIAQGIQ